MELCPEAQTGPACLGRVGGRGLERGVWRKGLGRNEGGLKPCGCTLQACPGEAQGEMGTPRPPSSTPRPGRHLLQPHRFWASSSWRRC